MRKEGYYWVRVGDLGENWDRHEWTIAQYFPGKKPKSLARQWFVYEPYRWMLEEDLLEIGPLIEPPTAAKQELSKNQIDMFNS